MLDLSEVLSAMLLLVEWLEEELGEIDILLRGVTTGLLVENELELIFTVGKDF